MQAPRKAASLSQAIAFSLLLLAAPAGAEAKTPGPSASPAATSPGHAAKADLPDPAAIVDGEKISRAELEETFVRTMAAAGLNPADFSPEQQSVGYREILDQLIVEKLVTRKASNTEIEDAVVDEEIARIKKQFSGDEAFRAALAQQALTEATLREKVKSGLQTEKWMNAQLGNKTKVSDAEVEQLYSENKKDLQNQPERVHASHILFVAPEGAPDDVVAAKKELALAALARVTDKGEDFATVAKETSEAPGAGENGGDLGYFTKEAMVKEFADAAFAMKGGETSKQPVRTKFGWHVIKVHDRKEAGTVLLDEVKDQLRRYLEASKRHKAILGVIDNLRAEAKVDNKLPSPAGPTNATPEN